MINKVSNLEKQSQRNINKIKLECEETIKRHQNFIDQVTLNSHLTRISLRNYCLQFIDHLTETPYRE